MFKIAYLYLHYCLDLLSCRCNHKWYYVGFTGKFYDKYGPRLIYTGFTILTITTIMLCFLHTDTSYTYLIVVYAIRMFSVSLLMMPINTTGINSLRNEEISHGTAIMNFGRVMAGSLGTALMVTLMSFGKNILIYIAIAFNCN